MLHGWTKIFRDTCTLQHFTKMHMNNIVETLIQIIKSFNNVTMLWNVQVSLYQCLYFLELHFVREDRLNALHHNIVEHSLHSIIVFPGARSFGLASAVFICFLTIATFSHCFGTCRSPHGHICMGSCKSRKEVYNYYPSPYGVCRGI